MRNKLLAAFLLLAVAVALIPFVSDIALPSEKLDEGQWWWKPVIDIGLTILLGFAAATLLSGTFTHRLLALAGAARKVADGDLTVPVVAEGRDEVSERGLEPPRAYRPLGPQPSASTNSATPT